MVLEDEGRFNFMLQPIRDLTKNWDVDIASHLEEYLEELETVAITFDGGRTMNFAEAALLIQGSTCVYSRKVEYLYSLVYEVLDLLVSKKHNKQKNKRADGNGDDPDVTFVDDDVQLIPLDDIETTNTLLKDKNKNEKEIGTTPRRPMSMVPLGEKEKGGDPLISKTGEILGSRNDFRLNTCEVSRNSSLLLEACAHSLCGTTAPTNKDTASTDIPTNTEDGLCNNFDNHDDDNDDGGVIFNDDAPGVEDPFPEENLQSNEEVVIKRSERIQDMMLKDRIAAVTAVAKVDPWAIQDPYEPKKKTEKSFKKSKTFRIPEVLNINKQKSKKRKKTPVEDEPKKELEQIGDFLANTLFSYKQKFPKVLQESCLPEFERTCWTKLSERQVKRKTEIKEMETVLEQQILEGENLQEEGNDLGADLYRGGDDDDNDDPVGPVLNLQDDLFDVEYDPPVFEHCENDEPVSSYEQLVQKHTEAFYVGAQKYALITELSKRITDWEDKILPKLQEEESHGPFDIHLYGTKILNSITKGKKFPLSKLMAGKPQYEIGRLFLSTLMLANTGNVELSCPGVLEEGMDKAEVTLIRTIRHFEELEQYIAPSLANKEN